MKYRGRYLLIGLSLLTVVGGLMWRVINLQLVEQNFLQNQGDIRAVRVVESPAYRGMILDRNGEALAISTPVDSVWLNPKEFNADHPALLSLAAILDTTVSEILDKVDRHKGREFVYLQRHVTPAAAEQIKVLKMAGIHLKPEYRRYYPAGEVASHVVGFTNIDDQGKEGLELALEETLKGQKGTTRVVKDRRGRSVQILEGLQETHSGKDVTLSIDQRLQYLAHRELKAAVVASRAVAGTAVVLDVKTGEVLAMVNQPSFNPNTRVKIKAEGQYRNRAVTDAIEPGSVLKTFSVLNAMQNGDFTPTSLVDTAPGFMNVGHHLVREDKNKNFGVIDLTTILLKSSNVGVTKLTLSLAPEFLIDTYSKVGFGQLTGSGFPGESPGKLIQPPKNGSFVLATMAFGYALTATPLQLAQAYATLGSGGVKRQVTFIKQNEIPAGEQVLDPVVARQVVEMLSGVVENGSGVKAKVVGYSTAGKTGTTRKCVAGGYQKNNHVAVFAGLAPASEPRFAIVVMVDDPQIELYYGSQLAAPVFSKIAAGAMRLFNVAPDIIEHTELRVAKVGDGSSLNE